MHLLYGVVGDGMGHATRSRVVIGHLLSKGHSVHVLASDRAFGFLARAFEGRTGFRATEIAGLKMVYRDNAVKRLATAAVTLRDAPAGLAKNRAVWKEIVAGPAPNAVISDFDTFSYLLGRHFDVPVLSIDNNHVLDRCRHDAAITRGAAFDFGVARAVVAARLPRAWHYIIASFYFPPLAKSGTTLVPPILRPEVLAARRDPRDHVLVYQTASTNRTLVPALRKLPQKFVVYGMNRDERDGNVTLRKFSETTFIDDLRTARAAIAGGGFSFLSEAVHLGVPVLSVPLRGQFEQGLNARWLERIGFGETAETVTADTVGGFLDRAENHTLALGAWKPRDNSILFACVDESLSRIAAGERRAATLAAGAWR